MVVVVENRAINSGDPSSRLGMLSSSCAPPGASFFRGCLGRPDRGVVLSRARASTGGVCQN
eukprot:9404993-Pyramimonas_sp.AAC.1